MWWRDAVVYQVYPRSFQDTNGDGIGDLPGVESRLGHVQRLGADALWLSPIHPSPLADFGYDITDHLAIDPVFGTLDDFDALVRAVHRRGMRLLMDLVPSHTSIEHPWFREHPDRYIWADGNRPPNNWRSIFGGPAWTRDPPTGRWYLHSFYPEQPDLDWRNPEVVTAMQDVVRFWRARGVDGFRIDAVARLIKDAELRDDPPTSSPFELPLPAEYAELEHLYSRNRPEIGDALAALRTAAGDALLVGEAYLPTARLAPYLEHLDLVFAFELFHSAWSAEELGAVISEAVELAGARGPGAAWVLSNHDFPRLAERLGPENVRVAAMLLLTLPGTAFVYQGDEIGLRDGPGGGAPYDRTGRDAHRHPMQWDDSPGGGFSDALPWLPPVDPRERNVAAQQEDPGSLLALHRRLIAFRRRLGEGFALSQAEDEMLVYERGSGLIALNLGPRERPAPAGAGPLELATAGIGPGERTLPPHSGAIYVRGS